MWVKERMKNDELKNEREWGGRLGMCVYLYWEKENGQFLESKKGHPIEKSKLEE